MQRIDVAEVLEDLVRSLVDRPDEAKVVSLEASAITVLEVVTARGDHGKVVGVRGQTADALREIVTGISGAQRWHYTLTLVPPESGQRVTFSERPRPCGFVQDPVEWTARLLERLIRLQVDAPDAVEVTTLEGRQAVIFELAVAPEDMNKAIGIKGARADAHRVLLAKLGARCSRRFMLEVLEPAASPFSP